jgi:hypothetical protein
MPVINPLGPETIVNTTTPNDQAQQAVLALADGRYIVVWVDFFANGATLDAVYGLTDIRAQLFNADGTLQEPNFWSTP